MFSTLYQEKHSNNFSLKVCILFFILGALFTLSFAPFNFFLLAPLVMVPLFYLCLKYKPKQTAIYLFFFGLGHFLSGLYWVYISVHIFGGAPVWAAILLMFALVILMSSYFLIAGFIISYLCRHKKKYIIIIGPSVWILIEWIRGWAFSGFPWLTIGYSQIDSFLISFAPLLGVYGVSWILLFSSSSFLYFFMKKQKSIASLSLIFPYILGYLILPIDWTSSFGNSMPVEIIQGGVAQDQKWRREQLQKTMEIYRKATYESEDNTLIIWPEVAIPASTVYLKDYFQSMQEHLSDNNKTLAIGALETIHNMVGSYNSFLYFNGTDTQHYRKRHLVPFGEYFPVPDFLREWMEMNNLPSFDLMHGEKHQSLIKYNDEINIAAAICYEIAFGYELLHAFPEANLLINVSNDAWFGDSIAPHQHLQITRMRAIETGRPIIRATNNGISAFINHKGKVVKKSGQFNYEILQHSVYPRKGSTLYVALGDMPVLLLSSFLILYVIRKKLLISK